jgi:hypothetical protein
MPVYTLVVTDPAGDQRTSLSDFPNDAAAIADTGGFVSVDHPSVALARDAGEEVEFLGAWDWLDGGAAWTPDC